MKATVRPPSQAHFSAVRKKASFFKTAEEEDLKIKEDTQVNIPMAERLSGYVDKKSPKGTGTI